MSCGAPEGGYSLEGINTTKESVIQGRVVRGESPVAGAYVRLLDRSGEFTAEVPTSEAGTFRFFAAPGEWTLRVLAPGGIRAERSVSADIGQVTKIEIAV